MSLPRLKKLKRNNEVTNIEKPAINSDGSTMICFLCNNQVFGRYYYLGFCRTQNSKSRVIDKLSDLIGDRYMLVVSDDEVICRSCANLMNVMDRLQHENNMVRDTILKFLEDKYSMEKGELVDNIKDDSQSIKYTKQITDKEDNTSSNGFDSDNTTSLKCDKCSYSTKKKTFMIHHIRQHIQGKVTCDKCNTDCSTS